MTDQPEISGMTDENSADKESPEPTPGTKARLWFLSHNRCAFPDCEEELSYHDRPGNFSNICHMAGARPGSSRYDVGMTNAQRRAYGNLLVLCTIHHIATNDEERYTIPILQKTWKDHIDRMRKMLSDEGVLTKHPTALSEVIRRIGSTDFFVDGDDLTSSQSFVIDDKIEHNKIQRFKGTIEEYRVYQGRLTKLYAEIEKEGSFRKELVLQNIKQIYLTAKSRKFGGHATIDQIQANADDLIEEVQGKLFDLLGSDETVANGSYREAFLVAVPVIIVDAFMRCKILEEPPAK